MAARDSVAQSNAPGYPQPGLNDPERANPLPLLTFTPSPSPCQQGGNHAAVGGSPGMAGPVATVPTTQMQDFGQVMGQVGSSLPSTDTGGSP